MTGGTAAGLILADLIVEDRTLGRRVRSPAVHAESVGQSFLEENATVGGSFIGDRIKSLLASLGADGATDIPPGDARVVRRASQPVGLYREADGTTHAVSATCPHMGCLVRWNDAEETWDCPCHGSRFTHEGKCCRALRSRVCCTESCNQNCEN